jgi:pilus assembly protein Flp/PilA
LNEEAGKEKSKKIKIVVGNADRFPLFDIRFIWKIFLPQINPDLSGPSFQHRNTFYQDRIRLMRELMQTLNRFLVQEDGPTAVEYAVMLALIIVVCIVAITTIGTRTNATFNVVGSEVGKTTS